MHQLAAVEKLANPGVAQTAKPSDTSDAEARELELVTNS